jgi:hypothetical protein
MTRPDLRDQRPANDWPSACPKFASMIGKKMRPGIGKLQEPMFADVIFRAKWRPPLASCWSICS